MLNPEDEPSNRRSKGFEEYYLAHVGDIGDLVASLEGSLFQQQIRLVLQAFDSDQAGLDLRR